MCIPNGPFECELPETSSLTKEEEWANDELPKPVAKRAPPAAGDPPDETHLVWRGVCNSGPSSTKEAQINGWAQIHSMYV